jgi:hypothetical protein
MENVFIIHRSKDAPKAEQLIASFAQEKDIAFLLLNGKRHFWKKEAKQKNHPERRRHLSRRGRDQPEYRLGA